jgi:hypothetical protein
LGVTQTRGNRTRTGMLGRDAAAAAENEDFARRYAWSLVLSRLRPEDRERALMRCNSEDAVAALGAAHPPRLRTGWAGVWKRHVHWSRDAVERVMEMDSMDKVKDTKDRDFFIVSHEPELAALHAKFWRTAPVEA